MHGYKRQKVVTIRF